MKYIEENAARLIAVANQNESLMDGTTVPVQAMLDASGMVWAIFQESDNGPVGFLLLKGAAALEQIATGTHAVAVATNAIKTVSYEMAIAAWRTLGEGAEGRGEPVLHWVA